MNKRFTPFISLGLSGLLLLQISAPAAHAQEVPAPKLNIVVVEGEGALNNVRQRTAREPVVRIEDENRRPIAGAAVMFTLPTSGPSGEFGNGEKTLTVVTDDQGAAAARGLRVNRLAGKLPIHVTASYRGEKATTVITQFNMEVPGTQGGGGGSGKMIAILAIVGAAAAGGVIAGTRGSGSTNTPPTPPGTPISVIPGTGTIGPPR